MSKRYAERRVMTALFIDVVGWAALTVQLGPERLKRSLDRAFLELKALITAEGGTVEKYVGDAIHALFGAPVAHADDPQRALRAAHACVRWAEASAGDPVPFAVRVGLETGEAIVDLAAAETEHQQMSVGACVNLAARLQQLAEPGQVLVGPTCREANVDAAEFIALGEVDLKGLGRVPVWRLVALTAPRPGARPPFVGREAELDLLRVAYRRASLGRSVLVVVSGPPGQGKTRLVEEFVAGLTAGVRTLSARCRPSGETGVRSPLRELLGSDVADVSMEGTAARMAELFHDPVEQRRVSTALAHSAGVRLSEELATLATVERQDEITNGWRRYLTALAREKPLVLWVEDVHWAETELVRLLDRLTLAGDASILAVATARPEFAERASLRPSGDRFFVELGALDSAAASTLARHVGGSDDVRIERAEGNPLFIIELARSRSVAPKRYVSLTLQGVIGARLDELPPRDRELLQRAAVVGETITVRDAALLSGRDPVEVAPSLERLADLLYLHPVSGSYRFHHALVRDVAYGRLPTAERMRLHARYAREGVHPEDAEALAHHLWEALGPPDADWVWEESQELAALRARAFEAHLAAGRQHAGRFAHERAVEIYGRALRFTAGPADAALVERAIADAYANNGEGDAAWEHYLRAHQLHRQAATDPPADLYPDMLELPVYSFGMFRRLPDDVIIEQLLLEGEAVARRAEDTASLARLLAQRSLRSGDTTTLEEALRLFEGAADPLPFVPLLQQAAVRQHRAGDFGGAKRTYERVDTLTGAGVRINLPEHLERRSLLAHDMGTLEEAEQLAERLVTMSASRGPHLRTHAYREKCQLLLARGDWRGLRGVATEVRGLVEDNPGTPFCYAVTTAMAFGAVAEALDEQGKEARALLERAEAMLPAPAFERENVLLLAYGALGRKAEVQRLIRNVCERGAPIPWFLRRTEVVVLTMLQRWDEFGGLLEELESAAGRGSLYVGALVSAVREEVAAAKGGPPPTHAMLRDLGYVGWSQLLFHRPAARFGTGQ